MNTPVVITAIWGEGHLPYLRALLESLRRLDHEPSDIIVAHHGLSDATLAVLAPLCVLRPFTPDAIADTRPSAQAAGKLAGWVAGLRDVADGEPVVFLDADTWVTKPLAGAFVQPFDVATTVHVGRERWPLNSGVVFARASPSVREWLEVWRRITMEIIADDERHQAAIDEYGAADQCALIDSAQYNSRGLNAAIYNEDWISDAPEKVAIWHMKGAMRAIRDGREDPRASQPVYREWKEAAGL